jgi:hypothetical protein
MRYVTTFCSLLLCLAVSGCGERDEYDPEEGIWVPDTAGDTAGDGEGGNDDGNGEDGGDDGPKPDAGDDDGGDGDGGDTGNDDGGDTGNDDGGDTGGDLPDLDPPAGESSGGAGGPQGSGVVLQTPTGEEYRIITPNGPPPYEFLLVLSGVEGGPAMTNNLLSLGGQTGTNHMLRAVIDGKIYFNNETVGERVLDDVRNRYDVDNDRTYLLSESAGTISGLYVGFVHRQSYFAAYWANDINAGTDPVLHADDIGFAPYGGVGPGGEIQGANDLVNRMNAKGYKLPPPAPYDGPGYQTHGDINQFIYALGWFDGKTRLD